MVSLLVGTHREGKRKFVHDRRVRPHGVTRGSPREDGCPSLAAVKVTCIVGEGLLMPISWRTFHARDGLTKTKRVFGLFACMKAFCTPLR